MIFLLFCIFASGTAGEGFLLTSRNSGNITLTTEKSNNLILSHLDSNFSVTWLDQNQAEIAIQRSSDVYFKLRHPTGEKVVAQFSVYCVGSIDERTFEVTIKSGSGASMVLEGVKKCAVSPFYTYIVVILLSAFVILLLSFSAAVLFLYNKRKALPGTYWSGSKSAEEETSNGVKIFDRGAFSLLRTTQEGTFGVCYQAEFFNKGERIQTLIKTISKMEEFKSVLTDQSFHTDAELLHGKLNCRISSLIGYVIDSEGPPLAIFPWHSGGNLKMFLKRCQLRSPTTRPSAKSTVTTDELVNLSVQAAEAMVYLSSIHVIHSDIAARNCQIGGDLGLFLCDKLLSRDLFPADYDDGIPVRWAAPETLEFPQHTSLKADMWSFGVLIWELMSLARAPYSDIESSDVEKYLSDGYRLVQPPGCPDELYRLVLQCWQFSPEKRPDTVSLLHTFQKMRNDRLTFKP